MEAANMESSLEMYKLQLVQVTQALLAAGNSDDLVKLKKDLQELISLTEASLLSLKKDILLQSLGVTSYDASQSGNGTPDSAEMDEEFAAFKAAIAEEPVADSAPVIPRDESLETSSGPKPCGSAVQSEFSSEPFDDISGTKCRVHYKHDWGSMGHHNAIVMGLEVPEEAHDQPMIRVMFCNPTSESLLPCKHYLDGSCHFSDDNCRYSHGQLINPEDLSEFKDPDYSMLSVGSRCLAKYKDGVWHTAKVDMIEDVEKFIVTFEGFNQTVVVDLPDILPLDDDDSSSSSSDDDDPRHPLNDEDSEDEAVPVFLWRPPKTTQALGEWESHTRGIGMKLMLQMGYVVGQGLGLRNDGRAEPVPIQLLPYGKSLDKIMKLKELSGDRDLYDVMKKSKKKKRKEDMKNAANYKKKEKANVFDFLNKKIGIKKGSSSHASTHHHGNQKGGHRTQQISQSDLKKKSDQHVNVQMMKTEEEIKNVEKELVILKQKLTRNEGRDHKVTKQTMAKMTSVEQYLETLKTSGSFLKQDQEKRKAHKKLTVF